MELARLWRLHSCGSCRSNLYFLLRGVSDQVPLSMAVSRGEKHIPELPQASDIIHQFSILVLLINHHEN